MTSADFSLKPHEEVLSVVRQSIIPNGWKFLGYGTWFLLPFFFLFPLVRSGMWGIISFFILLISGLFVLGRTYIRWSKTILIVTDKRVVDIDQKGYFDRTVTEVPYGQIDEVSYRVKGFWATVFRYGYVRLDVSGAAADIQFNRVSRPAHVHNLINDLREDYRQSIK